MTDQTEYHALEWRDGKLPVSRRFDDPYFSLQDGLAETRHVFLAGNDLPLRFAEGFCVAELGFGTGLNLLATWAAWDQAGVPGPLRFVSFEAFPMAAVDRARALAIWPELAPYADSLVAGFDGVRFRDATLDLEVIPGDAAKAVPDWDGQADAWFLDGFSPAKNPAMWTAGLMQAVADHTRASGTVATYTAAGHVRKALSDAGFEITRTSGFGRKRHMTRGVLR